MKRRTVMVVWCVLALSCLGLWPQEVSAWGGEVIRNGSAVEHPEAGRGASHNTAVPTLLISLRYPITGQGGMQTVWVSLVGADGRGVAGVWVRVSVKDSQGVRYYAAGPTNASGRAVCAFPVGQAALGSRVVVEALAIYRGVTLKGSASYLVAR